MKTFKYDTHEAADTFWKNEAPKILEVKNFILDVIFPYLEKNQKIDTKFFATKMLLHNDNKVLVLDSGKYKRVYFFLKSDEEKSFDSKLEDYQGKYLMAMFFIVDDNYHEDPNIIEKYMYKVFDYFNEVQLNEMIWNNVSFKRPQNININVHYNELKEYKPLSMDYLDAMFNISVVSSYLTESFEIDD